MSLTFSAAASREAPWVAAANTAAATNAAATVTLPAQGPGLCNSIDGIAWSYSGAGTLAGGNVQVADGQAVVLSLDITATGKGDLVFRSPLVGSPDTALTVTLAGGSTNVAGKVCVLGAAVQNFPPALTGSLDYSSPRNSALPAVL